MVLCVHQCAYIHKYISVWSVYEKTGQKDPGTKGHDLGPGLGLWSRVSGRIAPEHFSGIVCSVAELFAGQEHRTITTDISQSSLKLVCKAPLCIGFILPPAGLAMNEQETDHKDKTVRSPLKPFHLSRFL